MTESRIESGQSRRHTEGQEIAAFPRIQESFVPIESSMYGDQEMDGPPDKQSKAIAEAEAHVVELLNSDNADDRARGKALIPFIVALLTTIFTIYAVVLNPALLESFIRIGATLI